MSGTQLDALASISIMKTSSLSDRLMPAVRGGGFAMDDYWVWCPSVVRTEDGTYAMFASRWPKWMPFHPGWMLGSEVVLATAPNPEGPFTFRQVVLPARGAQYWDGRATHNPRILRHKDGYALFYTGITHPFPEPTPGAPIANADPAVVVARASKRVGVAFAKSIYGPWERLDAPILPTRPDTFYSFLTSNPSPCILPDGDVWLTFKSRAYVGNAHGPMLLGMARAGSLSGPYEVVGRVTLQGGEGEVEDPCLWHDGEQFGMIAKDMTGVLCGMAGGGVHVVSSDGLVWKKAAGAGRAWTRRVAWDDGVEETLGSLERPFLLFDGDGRATHFYAASADGPGFFQSMTRSWNLCMPIAPESTG